MAVVNDAVADAAEQVAVEALEVAEVSRSLSGRDLAIGFVVGAALGGGVAYLITVNKLRGRFARVAEREIDEMREHFHQKTLAAEGKPALDGLVKDLGYVPVTEEKDESPTVKPPVPMTETRNVFDEQPQVDHDWDYEAEERNRAKGGPFVIHYDELGETGYETATTFTYYAGDDVLCDGEDKIVEERDTLIGEGNLDRFGHGSNDPAIVYVRNSDIAAEFEIVRSDKTYAEEVHGITHADESYPRRRKLHFDDE